MIDFDLEGNPRRGTLATDLIFDPSTGVIPEWLTVGGSNAQDTGVTTSFPGGAPRLQVTSAVQSGSDVRRAAVFGPAIPMANVLGVRVRAVVSVGSSGSVHTVSMGFTTNPAIAPTALVEMTQVTSASSGTPGAYADINVLGAGVTETKKSRLLWLAPPARHDLFLHLTPADCLVEMGREGESDWAHAFGRDLKTETLYPFVMLRTKNNGMTAVLPLHRFHISIDYK